MRRGRNAFPPFFMAWANTRRVYHRRKPDMKSASQDTRCWPQVRSTPYTLASVRTGLAGGNAASRWHAGSCTTGCSVRGTVRPVARSRPDRQFRVAPTGRTGAPVPSADAHMVAINDNGFLPEEMVGRGWIESRDRARGPLERLMTPGHQVAAGRTGDRDARARRLQPHCALLGGHGPANPWRSVICRAGASVGGDGAGSGAAGPGVAAEAITRWGDDAAIGARGSLAAPMRVARCGWSASEKLVQF